MTPLTNGRPTLIATDARTAHILRVQGAVRHALAMASVSDGAESADLCGGAFSSSSSSSAARRAGREGEGLREREGEDDEER